MMPKMTLEGILPQSDIGKFIEHFDFTCLCKGSLILSCEEEQDGEDKDVTVCTTVRVCAVTKCTEQGEYLMDAFSHLDSPNN